jgi:hypothetical protein
VKNTLVNPQKVLYKEKPLLIDGKIIYSKSNHHLTFIGGKYSCQFKLKKQCDSKLEKDIKYQNFERKLISEFQKLAISDKDGIKIFSNLEKINIDLIEYLLSVWKPIMDNLRNTFELFKQSIKVEGKIKPSDIFYFKNEYLKLLKNSYPQRLLFIMKDTVQYLARPKYKRELAERIQKLVKTIYISDSGRITKIELEGLGDFLFQFLEKQMAGYFPTRILPIVYKQKFENLNILEVIKNWEKNSFRDTLSRLMFESDYSEQRQMERLFYSSRLDNPKEQLELFTILLEYHWKSPFGHLQNYYYCSDKDKPPVNKKYIKGKIILE